MYECRCACVFWEEGRNVLDFSLEMLFFFGRTLDFASAICVRLRCVLSIVYGGQSKERLTEMTFS